MQHKINYELSIKKNGLLNTDILKLIAYNNEGKQEYSLREIEAYLKCKISEYPATLHKMILMQLEDELVVMEDGENITLKIRKEK